MTVTPDHAMTLGLNLPYSDGAMDGATPRWGDILAMARAAEDVGFDAVWVSDHVGFGVQVQLRPNSVDAVEAFRPVLHGLAGAQPSPAASVTPGR